MLALLCVAPKRVAWLPGCTTAAAPLQGARSSGRVAVFSSRPRPFTPARRVFARAAEEDKPAEVRRGVQHGAMEWWMPPFGGLWP